MIARRSFEIGSFEISRSFETWAVISGSLLAGAAYAWFAGEDINWDWRNYHEYSAFALINGRFDQDVAPAGIQTFLNPLAYLPVYLLRHHVGAPFWGMMLGSIHGLNLALIYWFSRLVLSGAASGLTLAAAVVIAAFGPMTLSEVGTSFADILTALPVIAGLGLILSANAQHRTRYLIAGMLIGGAVGLKLTNMIFFLGAGASLLFAARPLMAMSYFAIGGAIGGLGTGGAWAWTLWEQFGNPVFPFYNTIFRSSEAPVAAIADVRFMPVNLWDAAAYPFYWLIGNHRSSEGPFRDPRFAILFVLFAVNAGASLFCKIQVFARRDKQFLLFLGRLRNVVVCIFNSSLCGCAGAAFRATHRPLTLPFAARLPGSVVEGPSASPGKFCGDHRRLGNRVLVAICGLVAPPVVRSVSTPSFRRASQSCSLSSDREAGWLYLAIAAARLARISTR